jgi:DNA-binding transcriptional LysR family regulator
VAVYFNSDWCRDYALHSLAQMAIPFRTAFECDTTGGFRAAVTNGLAVAPMARSAIPPGCRELMPEDGFGVIDQARVILRRNPRRASPALEAMVETLRLAFAPLAGGAT